LHDASRDGEHSRRHTVVPSTVLVAPEVVDQPVKHRIWKIKLCNNSNNNNNNRPVKVQRQRTSELLLLVCLLWWIRLLLPGTCLHPPDTAHTCCWSQTVSLSWQSSQGQTQSRTLCNDVSTTTDINRLQHKEARYTFPRTTQYLHD